MTPNNKRAAQRRELAANAVAFFKTQAEYPSVEVEIYRRINVIVKASPSVDPRSDAHFDELMQVFDIRAEVVLRLVSDITAHDHFMALLEDWANWVWKGYTGYSVHALPPYGAKGEAIRLRIAHWRNEGFKKLAGGSGSVSSHESSADEGSYQQGDRAGLLAAYKSATGNPSNWQIYNARNSGIHKPEFYKWLKGELHADSETTKNFERFLREKRAPIRRKPKG